MNKQAIHLLEYLKCFKLKALKVKIYCKILQKSLLKTKLNIIKN